MDAANIHDVRTKHKTIINDVIESTWTKNERLKTHGNMMELESLRGENTWKQSSSIQKPKSLSICSSNASWPCRPCRD